MTNEEVKTLLSWVKKKKPNCFSADKSKEVYETWCKALAKYSKEEVNTLFQDGGFALIPHYNYTNKALVNLVQALDDQRSENTEKSKALERYRKACEKMPKPVPQTEHKPLFDCVNCADKDKQYCGGGICMKMLGGAR